MTEVLVNTVVVMILQYVCQISMLYTLNLHSMLDTLHLRSVTCQFYLNEAGKNKTKNCRKPSDPENSVSLPAHLQVGHASWMGGAVWTHWLQLYFLR